MPDTSRSNANRGRSRRSVLAAGAGLGSIAVAGCVADALGSSGRQAIEPEEPSTPREGTPGEFYSLVEANDIEVDSLYRDGTDLILLYRSGARTERESIVEIEVIATVYNENLVRNDAGIEMLYAEVVNPFDGQAHGWGVKTEWCEHYNRVVDEEASANDGGETSGTERDDTDADQADETDENEADETDESEGDKADEDEASESETLDSGARDVDEDDVEEFDRATMARIVLVNNILNSRVYAEDL